MYTLDLVELKAKTLPTLDFSRGELLEFVDIEGVYTFGKFHPWITIDGVEQTGQPDSSKTYYYIWIDGEDANRASGYLEQAMIIAIALKLEGNPDTMAGYYIMRMFGLE